MDDYHPKKRKVIVKTNTGTKKGMDKKWLIHIVVWSFVLSILVNYLSGELLEGINVAIALLVLLFIIFIGVLFDAIGLAVATADEAPFHALGARKVHGTKQAIFLIRNAEKVSNFCGDVVGDIAGIVSGATGVAIAAKLAAALPGVNVLLLSLATTGVIASLTISGKALGKILAMSNANHIVYLTAKVLYFFRKLVLFKKEKD